MSNSTERFRLEFATQICSILSQDQLRAVIDSLDLALSDYEISRKQMEIITSDGYREIVNHFLAAKAIANCSMTTLKQYNYKLTNFFNTIKKSYLDVKPDDIRKYLNMYRVNHNASDTYRDNIRITLNSFFQWLVNNERLTANPCANVEKVRCCQKVLRPLTPYELEICRFRTVDVREKALIDFFFSTGVRVSECASVRITDIDWQNRSVLVRHGKGNKQRIVYFNAESEASLRAYLNSRTDGSDALFVSVRAPHKPIGPHALENILKKVGKRSGFHVHPHKLRRTFATHCIDAGMSLEQVQLLMGHVSPATTMRYVTQNNSRVQMEHRRVYS